MIGLNVSILKETLRGFFMKKSIGLIAAFIILIIGCITLTACDPNRIHLKQEELSDIVSVELVKYDNSKQKCFFSWIPDHSSDLKPFDDSKLSVMETLPVDKIPQFIDTLCECDIFSNYYAYDSPNGICFKLSYSNGDFLIVNGKDYIGKFSSDGEVAEFIGCFSNSNFFKTLVNNYFRANVDD